MIHKVREVYQYGKCKYLKINLTSGGLTLFLNILNFCYIYIYCKLSLYKFTSSYYDSVIEVPSMPCVDQSR